jgi:hypothetical protein
MSGHDNINFSVIDDHATDEATTKANISSMPISTFDDRIREYLKTNTPCVYILTPCFGSVCYTNYVYCLLATLETFRRYGIKLHIEFCKNDSLVSRARNNLVARAMSDKTMTHIMFIDNDITWDPMDIIKLLLADKPLVGGIYPLKNYQFNTIVKPSTDTRNANVAVQTMIDKKNKSQFKDLLTDEQMIEYNLVRYNINYLNSTLNIEKNLAKVKHMATGFMMIKRHVIEKMSKAFPSTKYVDDVGFLRPEENEFAYALFDCGVEEGHYFSEDWLFCHRWTKMKGEIHVDVSINLTHTGITDYKGCFLASLI